MSSPSTLAEYLKLSRPEYRDSSKRARLQYLYSDISQAKANNPAGFASSLSWWSNLITDIVSRGLQNGGGDAQMLDASDKLVWQLDQEFAERLRWEGAGKPTGLGTVAMQLSQISPLPIIPMTAFMSSLKPIDSFSWTKWVVSKVVAAPLWWSMGKIGLVDNDSSMPEQKAWKLAQGEWVMIDTLKQAAESIANELNSKTSIVERLYTYNSFAEEYDKKALPGVRLSSRDIQVLVKYLQRDKRVLIADKDTIKILAQDEEGIPQITETDRGILRVKQTSATLEIQIADLEQRISDRQAKISNYIKSGQKDLALSHLRSKKALLDLLSKRTMAQENLSAVLLKIEAAESDVSILSAYQSATSSLKSLLAHPSLQRDKVENTMEDLQEALADQKEIESIVTDGGKQAAGLEDVEDEIQEELALLQKEADEEKRKREEELRIRQKHEEQQERAQGPEKIKSGQSEETAPSAADSRKQALPA